VNTSVEQDDTPKKARAAKAVVKKSPKKCEDGKVRNPETGRCILLKNAIAKGIIIKEKEKGNVVDKKCEDGKVLNPETGRCILLKNAIAKGIVVKK
jgi:hypothetical protein